MRRILLSLIAVFFTFSLPMPDAEAKRMGGGKSYGMQREAPMKRDAAPRQDQNNQTQNTPASSGAAGQAGGRSWLGPVAGIAAALGLAALFSHLGLGEEMASFLMLALLAMAAFLLVRWFLRRNQPGTGAMQYAGQTAAGGSAPLSRPAPLTPAPAQLQSARPMPGSVAAELGDAPAPDTPHLPPGFDAEAFSRQAKVNFIRLQAANDAGDLDDLRAFTTPEMYAELKLDIDERRGVTQRTEVVELHAEVLEAVEEGRRHIASVRFHGLIAEDGEEAAPFDETWHLSRPADGSHGWLVAGIQQNA